MVVGAGNCLLSEQICIGIVFVHAVRKCLRSSEAFDYSVHLGAVKQLVRRQHLRYRGSANRGLQYHYTAVRVTQRFPSFSSLHELHLLQLPLLFHLPAHLHFQLVDLLGTDIIAL